MALEVLEGCVVVQTASVAVVTVGAFGNHGIRDVGEMCSHPNNCGSTGDSGSICNNSI